MSDDDPAEFSDVLRAELFEIESCRLGAPPLPAAAPKHRIPAGIHSDDLEKWNVREQLARARDLELTGLALSGGGIRSATFCLGVLQGMADVGMLNKFDYLSTVSGGGYIGGWLAAWVKRAGGIERVERQLRASRIAQAQGRSSTINESKREADAVLTAMQEADAGDGAGGVITAIKKYVNRRAQDDAGRLASAALNSVKSAHVPVTEEPEPIVHLRNFSNYLTPKVGLDSPDTWVMLAIYLRNLLLNQLILIPAMLALVFICRLALVFYSSATPYGESSPHVIGVITLLIGGLAAGTFLYGLTGLHHTVDAPELLSTPQNLARHTRNFSYVLTYSLLATAFFFCWSLADSQRFARWPGPYNRYVVLFWACAGSVLAAGLYFASREWFGRRLRGLPRGPIHWLRPVGLVTGGLLCGALCALCVGLVYRHMALDSAEISRAELARMCAILVTFGPPAFLLALSLSGIILQATVSRALSEAELEWHASIGSWLLATAYRWTGLMGLALFGYPTVLWLASKLPAAQAVLGAGWISATVASLLSGKPSSKGESVHRPWLGWFARIGPYVFLIGLVISLSAAADWLVRQSSLTDDADRNGASPDVDRDAARPAWLIWRMGGETRDKANESTLKAARYWDNMFLAPKLFAHKPQPVKGSQPKAVSNPTSSAAATSPVDDRDLFSVYIASLYWSLGCLALGFVTSFAVGVNTFSLHNFYRNRLVRCYLGASRPKEGDDAESLRGAPAVPFGELPRRPDPVTGFAPHDDIALNSLRFTADLPPSAPDNYTLRSAFRTYRGPYLLINTALNLVQGDELAWQERKAESFLMSPQFCGSKSTKYRRSHEFGGGIQLGTAMTTSGAAVSPNMGSHSSRAVTALLTLFNLRLGIWLGNPRREASGRFDPPWKRTEPRSTLLLLLKEFFGRTNRYSSYVYLSDGGHFENLGVYELVRRHCRFIVVVDADQDRGYAFSDLGGMIRKCRSDLGVPINIDVTHIGRQSSTGRSQWHCAIGTVHYDEVDPGALPGVLVYIKTSLTGNEPADVLNYAVEHPAFPHQSTTNQWFSESQFEAYRALGHHIAHEVFEEAARDLQESSQRDEAVRRLFQKLARRWSASPAAEAALNSAAADFVRIVRDMRANPKLSEFTKKLYPDIFSRENYAGGPAGVTDDAEVRRAELHTVSQMLQVMENAWRLAQLENYGSHTANRGWINMCVRWLRSDAVRKYWPALRGEYGREFVRFCEDELNIDWGDVVTIPVLPADVDKLAGTIRTLREEFLTEWPAEVGLGDLDKHLAKSFTGIQKGYPKLELIAITSSRDKHPSRWSSSKLPCGFILWEAISNRSLKVTLWISGPYRNLGMGSKAFRPNLEGLDASITPFRTVQTFMPLGTAGRNRSPARLQEWHRFFQGFGFKVKRSGKGSSHLTLVRAIP
jgi:predicted acylesterase/phospholipase RssA